jgi:hypothetical protein
MRSDPLISASAPCVQHAQFHVLQPLALPLMCRCIRLYTHTHTHTHTRNVLHQGIPHHGSFLFDLVFLRLFFLTVSFFFWSVSFVCIAIARPFGERTGLKCPPSSLIVRRLFLLPLLLALSHSLTHTHTHTRRPFLLPLLCCARALSLSL